MRILFAKAPQRNYLRSLQATRSMILSRCDVAKRISGEKDLIPAVNIVKRVNINNEVNDFYSRFVVICIVTFY